MILCLGQHVAFHLAKEPATMAPMTSYEPDPKTARLFARHKQATETLRETKKPVATALEDAIRQGATSPQLAALTGMSTQAIRNLAERLGVDIRVKAPTVGREAEAARASYPAAETVEFAKPAANIRKLTGPETRHLAEVATERAPERAAHYDRIAHASPYGYYSVVEAALMVGDLRKADLDS